MLPLEVVVGCAKVCYYSGWHSKFMAVRTMTVGMEKRGGAVVEERGLTVHFLQCDFMQIAC